MVSLEFCLCGDLTSIGHQCSRRKQWEPHLALQGFLDMVPDYELMHKWLYVSVLRLSITSLCACTDLCRHDTCVLTSKHNMYAELKAKFKALWSWQFMSERTTSSRTVLIRAMREQSPPKMSSGALRIMNWQPWLKGDAWCKVSIKRPAVSRFTWVFCSCSYATASSWRFSLVFFTIVVMKSLASSKVLRSGKGDHLATHEEALQIKNAFLESFVCKNLQVTEWNPNYLQFIDALIWHWELLWSRYFLICWLSGFK